MTSLEVSESSEITYNQILMDEIGEKLKGESVKENEKQSNGDKSNNCEQKSEEHIIASKIPEDFTGTGNETSLKELKLEVHELSDIQDIANRRGKNRVSDTEVDFFKGENELGDHSKKDDRLKKKELNFNDSNSCTFQNSSMNRGTQSLDEERRNCNLIRSLDTDKNNKNVNAKTDHLSSGFVHKKEEKNLTKEYEKEGRSDKNSNDLKSKTTALEKVIIINHDKEINNTTKGNGKNSEISQDAKSCLNIILENPNLTEREEGELVDDDTATENEYDLGEKKEMECLRFDKIHRSTVKNQMKREQREKLLNRNTQRSQNKTTDEDSNVIIKNSDNTGRKRSSRVADTALSPKKILKNSNKKKSEGELHADSRSNKRKQELETRICKELKDNIEVLKVKCSEIKRKLNAEEENISSDYMYKCISELKTDLSRYLQSFKDLKLKGRNEKSLHDRYRVSDVRNKKSNSSNPLRSPEKKTQTLSSKYKCRAKSCRCFEQKYSQSRHKNEHKLRRNSRERYRYYGLKDSSKVSDNTKLISTHLDSRNHSDHARCPKEPSSSNSSAKVKTRLKRRNSEEITRKKNTERKRIRSLFSRQMNLINKYVSKADDYAKHIINSGDAAKDVQERKQENSDNETLHEKFTSEINTLEDMELFLSFLKQQKRKTLKQNGIPYKKTKGANHVDARITDHRHIETRETILKYSGILKKNGGMGTKSKKAEKKKINYFSTQKLGVRNIDGNKEGNEIEGIDTDNEVVRNTYKAEQDRRSETPEEKEKFQGKISTLEDMESFLSFLRKRKRKRKTSNDGTLCKKTATSKSRKNTRNDKFSVNTHQECNWTDPTEDTYEKERARTNKSVEISKLSTVPILDLNRTENISNFASQESNKSIPVYRGKDSNEMKPRKSVCQNSLKPDDTEIKENHSNWKSGEKYILEVENDGLSVYDSTLYVKIKDDEIRKKNAKFITKRLPVQYKAKVSNCDISPKHSNRSLNSGNSENEEISLEKMESFLQYLKAREMKGGKAEEISTLSLNHEMEDPSLKLSRERRKAKLMACVTVKPEKISKILKDLREAKLGVNGDNLSKREYEKMLQKIVAETKTISRA